MLRPWRDDTIWFAPRLLLKRNGHHSKNVKLSIKVVFEPNQTRVMSAFGMNVLQNSSLHCESAIIESD
jgi:hypothetical protein